MRLLCFDHGAFLRAYRRRYVEMARHPGVELVVVAPRRLNELNYAGQVDRVDETECEYELIWAPFVPSKVHRGFFDPLVLARTIRRFRPDLIQSQGEPETWSSAQLCAMRRALAPRSRFVFATWMNVNLYPGGWPYFGSWIYDRTYRLVLRHAQGATAYSDGAARMLAANGFRGRIRTVPWGVDPEAFRSVAPDGLREQLGLAGLVVGYVGRMDEGKGVPTLLRALAHSQQSSTLLAVGEGPKLASWEASARAMGVAARWVGRVDNRELPRYLRCLDVLVLPSERTKYWSEQFGKILVEAMACGIPVIGSDSGEIPLVVGDAGLIFQEGNDVDLGAKIRQLATSPGLREACVDKGLQRVRSSFAWEVIAGQTLEFYRELLETSGS